MRSYLVGITVATLVLLVGGIQLQRRLASPPAAEPTSETGERTPAAIGFSECEAALQSRFGAQPFRADDPAPREVALPRDTSAAGIPDSNATRVVLIAPDGSAVDSWAPVSRPGESPSPSQQAAVKVLAGTTFKPEVHEGRPVPACAVVTLVRK